MNFMLLTYKSDKIIPNNQHFTQIFHKRNKKKQKITLKKNKNFYTSCFSDFKN